MCNIHICALQSHFISEFSPVETTQWNSFPDTTALQKIAATTKASYLLFYLGTTPVKPTAYAWERLQQVAQYSQADLIYSDYVRTKQGQALPNPTLDYQSGSLRDDFDFGPLLLYKADAFREAVAQMDTYYRHAALYDLRLKIARKGRIFHIPEFLYTVEEADNRKSGEKQFDYVDPRNREVQQELEQACTAHLKAIGAWLPPVVRETNLDATAFPVEASVVIPVKNRVKTIADAIRSVLSQQTDFRFNILVVDNHSDDGTSQAIAVLAAKYPQVIHHIPDSHDLGIGGCWTAAIEHADCGKFAVQLDSDDLYAHPRVLQTIVRTFYEQKCAMVIGSYRMVDFNLEEIPPGIIDHREWTDENGHNNALRINGLGAPRAFYTPILREIRFPNVSYGEDYAVGLAISRDYRIGRIYEPLYLCRRWEGNSDAALDIRKLNTYNFYKDKIRTLEIFSRTTKIIK